MPAPTWHEEATRLYKNGVHVADIARMLNKSWSAVAFAVDHQNAREKHRRRVAANKRGMSYFTARMDPWSGCAVSKV